MSNPLDDAFAKAEQVRAVDDRLGHEKDRAAKLAARDWIEAYREVLEALPRHVSRPPERIVLAWSPEIEPPSSVAVEGQGRDGKSTLAFGSCEAWCFVHLEPYEKGNRRNIYVSADCTTVFSAERSAYVRTRRSLRTRSISARRIHPFVDVRNGRHTLSLTVSPGIGAAKYRVSSSNLPSPAQLAEIIAGLKLSSSPAIRWVR
jgi:hypothetical protein